VSRFPVDTAPNPRALHPAWLALGVTFLVLLVAAAVRATPSVLFLPLEQEFRWSRSTVSLAVSVNILLYGLVGPFAGALMQRLGVRRTTLLALTLLASGVSLATLVRQPWQLVLVWGVVVGVGSGMAALVLGATIVMCPGCANMGKLTYVPEPVSPQADSTKARETKVRVPYWSPLFGDTAIGFVPNTADTTRRYLGRLRTGFTADTLNVLLFGDNRPVTATV